MSLEFVLDSSVTMAWFFQDEATSATDELLDKLNADARAGWRVSGARHAPQPAFGHSR